MAIYWSGGDCDWLQLESTCISHGIFCSVDILKIDVDMSLSLGYRDMATIATNDDPSTLYIYIYIFLSRISRATNVIYFKQKVELLVSKNIILYIV